MADGAPGFARITLPLAAINFLNQANRALVATIGPLLALEFGLSAAELGLLAACFFGAYALAQLPIGVALDLHGPRKVQSVLALVSMAGFVVSALAPDARTATLQAARRLVRLGGRVELIERIGGGLLGARTTSAEYVGSGGAEGLLRAAGFNPVRTLAERDGFRFVEGLKA